MPVASDDAQRNGLRLSEGATAIYAARPVFCHAHAIKLVFRSRAEHQETLCGDDLAQNKSPFKLILGSDINPPDPRVLNLAAFNNDLYSYERLLNIQAPQVVVGGVEVRSGDGVQLLLRHADNSCFGEKPRRGLHLILNTSAR